MQLTKEKAQLRQREKVIEVMAKTAANAYVFYLKLRNKLGHQWAMIMDYVSPGVEEAEDIEIEWIASGVLSILHVIDGDDPFESYCRMSPEERLQTLRMISQVNAVSLGIPPCPVERDEYMSATTLGEYRDVTRMIYINHRLIDEQPISVETAKEAILNVVHETFHAYQYTAAYSPKKYGLSPTVAARWRENARNYCSFEKNPRQYWLQSLEVYARYVQEGVQEWLADEEQVRWYREQFAQGNREES